MKSTRWRGDCNPPLFALRLRALVSALGEVVQPAWWKTEFMKEAGLRFLERIYPRTAFHAAVHASGKAACVVHDRAVGRIGVYHLFRLPESLETEIHLIPPEADDSFVSACREALGSEEKLLRLLETLAGGRRWTRDAAGAKRIGDASELTEPEVLEKVAAFYLHAFRLGKPGFPYFTP